MSILSGSSNVLLHIFVYLSDSPLAYVGLAYLCLHPAPCLGTGTWKQAKAIIAYWQMATTGWTGTEGRQALFWPSGVLTVSQRDQPGQVIAEFPSPPFFLQGEGEGKMRNELLDFK